ncbi:MAG TPA: hypothetical protein VFO72_10140 [Pyrinomonadaceae bacterium]|nr:hypothetical protein [Pyrinomonadaceae bacterium]
MRRETNNDIDLLLRRLSRRDGISAADGEAQNADTHLDADELSSYAQNALPATARARYTEHLAECSTCRKLVTELSLSLGATAASRSVETVLEPSGLKKFLAALFSPMVLRYAVPALGVIVVMVVGFVVLRRQQQSYELARVDVEKQQRGSVPAVPETPAPTPASGAPLDGFVDAPEEKAGNTQRPAINADESRSASGTTAKTDAISPPARVASQRQEGAAGAGAVAVASPSSPRAKTEIAEAEAKKDLEATAKRQAEPRRQTGDFQAQKESANEAARDRRTAPAAATGSVDQNKPKAAPSETQALSTARPASRGRVQSEKDESDTRSIAGRRFRKERGIWVDTAYDSSTATVNVARGSEQFRALIADEPVIKAIAEQLDGEVIIVWKGRAYRIR